MDASDARGLTHRAGGRRTPRPRRSALAAALLALLLLSALAAAFMPAGAAARRAPAGPLPQASPSAADSWTQLTAKAAKPAKPAAKSPKGTIAAAKPTFIWSKAKGAAKYELRVYKGTQQLLKKSGLTKRSWKAVKALPANVTLTWKVRGSSAAGRGAWSKQLAFRVVPLSSAKAISAFSFAAPAATGVINEADHTIALSVPFGTNFGALVASFTTTGTSVTISGTPQISGVTAVNFNNPVTYTVTAADSSTQDYTVTVTAALNPAKAITAFSIAAPAATGVINEADHTIALNVPFGTNLGALVASFTTTGTSVTISGTPQISGVTAVNFNNPVTYRVTAADASTLDYLVTVTVAAPPLSSEKAITAFSFASPAATGAINEALHTIAVTVPYGTNLTALVPTITISGASVSPASGAAHDFTGPVTYRVTAADASTEDYLVTVMVAAPPPSSAKAISAFSFAFPAATGVINETAHTIAVAVPYGTTVGALVASFTTTGASVRVGATPQTSGTTANNFSSPVTYTVTAADASTQDYLVTVTVAAPPLSSAKAITAFSFSSPAATGVINETLHTIAVTVPFGTNVSALVPSITISGASLSPLSGVARNFTSPVTYTVTAADASTQDYTVTVTAALSPAKAITAFGFVSPAATGVINESLHTIAVSVPYGTSLSALVASFTTTGASVRVGATPQASGTTANNFSGPVTYTVTAADASTQDYVVTVAVLPPSSEKAITAFSFASPAATGVIEGTTIAVTVPFGTNVTALVPTIAITGASVSPASGVAQNFTSRVEYTVTAADASTRKYGVTVTVAAPVIGQSYGGGIIAYVLQSGDPGFDANVWHGLIAAAADQSAGIQWALPANQDTFVPGGTGTALGTGATNTSNIIDQNGWAGTYAANVARSYTGGDFFWHLPSKDELNKLYLNQAAIGGFDVSALYWSSSESFAGFAVCEFFGSGDQANDKKFGTQRVRAVRSF